jgi:FkbM family methyltransferase
MKKIDSPFDASFLAYHRFFFGLAMSWNCLFGNQAILSNLVWRATRSNIVTQQGKTWGRSLVRFRYRGKEIDIVGYSDDDWIYSRIRNTGSFYEIDLLEYMLRVLPSNGDGCFLDIGANIGNHAVCISRFSGMRVVCFEPNPRLKSILERNLSVNDCEFRIYDCALGAENTSGVLEMPDWGERNIGMARIATESDSNSDPAGIEVPIRKLDELVSEVEDFSGDHPISTLKIDVEGMELSVLQGARSLLRQYQPDLFLEARTEDDLANLASFLATFHYKPIVRWAKTPVWHFVHESKLGLFRKLKLHVIINFLKLRARLIRLRKKRLSISGRWRAFRRLGSGAAPLPAMLPSRHRQISNAKANRAENQWAPGPILSKQIERPWSE